MHPELIAQWTAPLVVLLGGGRWLVGIMWKRYEATRMTDRAHATDQAKGISDELAIYQETTLHTLSRIEEQTKLTNGRVSALELRQAKVEGILEERNRS